MTAIRLLDRVLELYKKYNSGSAILDYLLKHDMLHSSFEQRYILNNDNLQFTVTNEIHKSDTQVEFYLDATDGCPYQAEVIYDKKWCLKSLRFQCQGCFGNDNLCGVCDGSGWGVL